MAKGIMLGCVGLAMMAALAYFLTGAGLLQPGNLTTEEAPQAIAYVAGVGYIIIGGLLILVLKRWLWITGATINLLIIVIFVGAYSSRTDVLLSTPGLGTKIPEIILEIGLIYLIAPFRKLKA